MRGGAARRRSQNSGLARIFAAAAAGVVVGAMAAGRLDAQLGGRWLIVVRGGAAGPVQGELRLAQTGPRVGGTLWLETRDAGPQALVGAEIGGGGTIEFTADDPGGPARFVGHLDGDELRGELHGDVRPRSWSASRLPENSEYYPSLPRFVVHAVVAGRRDSVVRLPGAWLAAADELGPTTFTTAYGRGAAAAGLTALAGDTLVAASALRAMGVLRRPELVASAIRTLEAIRAGLTDPRVRARFDQLFRPRGEWQVDLHDVALARARVRLRSLGPRDAVPALQSIGWLPRDTLPDSATLTLALYRLFTLGATDSLAARTQLVRMRADQPASAAAVATLLDGYSSATAWYADAMRFFLDERWIPGPEMSSLADAIRTAWGDSAATPAIEVRVFGYPQAVPRYGVPDSLFSRLVHADNWAAEEWLRRHGRGGFLIVLHRLRLDYGPTPAIVSRDETLRLASPGALAGEDANGFLEPRDAIAIDPGYMPLLALGATVHEWQHLLFQRRLLERGIPARPGPIVLPAADPYLAEGVAEWRAERIMASVVARFPLLGVAELEKRARLQRTSPNDPHVLGYRMVGALARTVGDDDRVIRLLVDAAAGRRGAADVLDDPVVSRAWSRHAAAPVRTVSAPARRALVPEFTFTIEDEFPDLLASRIVLP